MTEQLILTTAQRDQVVERLTYGGINQESITMLQSLPMASAEPMAWFENEGFMPDVGNKKVDINWGDGTFSSRVIANQFPWHKLFSPYIVEWRYSDKPSPQPLRTIKADDVTAEILSAPNTNTHPASSRAEILAAAYNAVIKNRSEAK